MSQVEQKISSIISKLKRINAKDIETEIDDIAGIRIMCQFVEDIYAIVDLIKVRNDMTIIGEKIILQITKIVVIEAIML